jgi:hypothetical protein
VPSSLGRGLASAALASAALAAAASGPSAAGDGSALLPDLSLNLKAARYAPTEADLQWTGWIGAGAGLVRHRGVTAYFNADVETILGDTLRPFEANQANYHLELGARRPIGGTEVTAFFHHVSRHLVDRAKTQAVDWNVLGVRARAPLPREFFVPTRVTLGLGHTTLASLVGYRLEMTLRVEADLLARRWGQVYAVADTRVMTTTRSAAFPRSGFIDFTLEGGTRFGRDRRWIETFLAYEHRNDVFLEAPGTRSRALLGFRLGFSGGEARPPQTPASGTAPASACRR